MADSCFPVVEKGQRVQTVYAPGMNSVVKRVAEFWENDVMVSHFLMQLREPVEGLNQYSKKKRSQLSRSTTPVPEQVGHG